METVGVDAALFIGTVIAALTEVIRRLVPAVTGVVTIVVASLVGLLVGFIDQSIGVTNVSPAAGLMIGLGTAGVVAVVQKNSTGTGRDVERG